MFSECRQLVDMLDKNMLEWEKIVNAHAHAQAEAESESVADADAGIGIDGDKEGKWLG